MTSLQTINSEILDWNKQQGLIPAIIQHYHTGKVLMLGYMNQAALQKTLSTQKVTFFSRTKQRLWTKGESSGNTLNLINISQDCDNDSLLVQVEPTGPTCHKGTESCWPQNNAHPFINTLETLIHERKCDLSASSYTANLFKQGTKRIAQKVGEEGLETALAAATNDQEELINEASDLIYHLLVLLEDQNISLSEVNANLAMRHQQAKK